MRILALSDEVIESFYTPAIRERFGDVDLILGCGDLPFYYLEFIVTVLNKPLYYVPGNHDKTHQYMSDGRLLSRAEGCEELDGLCIPVDIGGQTLLLAGLGGSLEYNREGAHQYSQGAMHRRALGLAPSLTLNRLTQGRFLDILVTHSPPRGIHDAQDLAHTGFDAFLRFMDYFQPRFLLHGHSHVYRRDTITETRYKQTQVINVYPYKLIEF